MEEKQKELEGSCPKSCDLPVCFCLQSQLREN